MHRKIDERKKPILEKINNKAIKLKYIIIKNY